VQSALPAELRLLDRLHTFEQVVEGVAWARAAGFDAGSYGLNLDLIYGLPHQTLAGWQETLRAVLALAPEHLSLYALTLEHGTPMQVRVGRGLLPLPDPDLAADMYEWASDALEAHRYSQYEISNWARASDNATDGGSRYVCRHNLQTWRNLPYLGLGAGAHGCAQGWRYANVLSPRAYIKRMGQGGGQPFPFSPATAQKNALDRETEMDETMLLGFRLVQEGVRAGAFRARFGVDPGERYSRDLGELRALGLIEWDAGGARLTRRGRLLANHVFRRFV
jgi:oxygen-independent coproporphyrinogen-3 oxidase